MQHRTFRAWLSDDTDSPSTRLDTSFGGRYILVDDKTVATGWADLTDAMLSHTIDRTELGVLLGSKSWTNTQADGTATGADYDNWTSSKAEFEGASGLVLSTSATWTEFDTVRCHAAQCSIFTASRTLSD